MKAASRVRMLLAGVLTIGGASLISSTAGAQDVRRPAAVSPPSRVTTASYVAPRVAPRYASYGGIYYIPAAPRYPVYPHTRGHRDWSTGRDNLPLAKPWMHSR